MGGRARNKGSEITDTGSADLSCQVDSRFLKRSLRNVFSNVGCGFRMGSELQRYIDAKSLEIWIELNPVWA